MSKTQNFKNHARLDPWYHGVLFFLNLILLIGSIRWFLKHSDGVHGGLVIASVTLFILTFKVRIYALHNQDRIIRLEERVRLYRLMPLESSLIESLTIDQLIGLRFASDAEVPILARRAIAEGLDRKAIKMAIVDWRADEFRI